MKASSGKFPRAYASTFLFFIWASRRGLGGNASKRRKKASMNQRWGTLAPPRAVGLSVTMFFFGDICFPQMQSASRPDCGTLSLPQKKHFHFNPSRTPDRNKTTFRGEQPSSLARTFYTRRKPGYFGHIQQVSPRAR